MNSRGGPSLLINNFSESYGISTTYIIFSRNTWNTVYAAGGWRLIQCNWAMLNLHSRAERETRKFYQDHYFLTDPDKFIFEFFPINSEWQLMERPITIQEFEDLPLLRSTFFHFGLGLEGNNAASIIDTNEAGEVFFRIFSPKNIYSICAIKTRDLYTFYSLFEVPKRFFKGFFFLKF